MPRHSDYHSIARELAAQYDLSPDIESRIEAALHAAHVAGEEHVRCACSSCRRVDEDIHITAITHLGMLGREKALDTASHRFVTRFPEERHWMEKVWRPRLSAAMDLIALAMRTATRVNVAAFARENTMPMHMARDTIRILAGCLAEEHLL